MNYRGQFNDLATGQAVPFVHVLLNGQPVAIADASGRWNADVAPGSTLTASHVSYGRQDFLVDADSFYLVQLREAVNTLPEVVITPDRRGLPWWAWAIGAAIAGRVFRLW